MFSTASLLETLLAHWESSQSSSVTDEILRALGSSSGTRVCLYSWAQAKGVLTSPTHNLENTFSFASLPNAEYRKGTFGGQGLGNQWRLVGFAKGMHTLLFRLHALWNSSAACSTDKTGMGMAGGEEPGAGTAAECDCEAVLDCSNSDVCSEKFSILG